MESYINQALKAWHTQQDVQTMTALLALLLAERAQEAKHAQDTETLLEYANLCM